MVRHLGLLALLSLALLAVACGDDDTNAVIDGDYHHFAVNKISLPENTTQANTYGFDLDNTDGANRPDNKLGQVLASLADQGLSSQVNIDEAVDAGSLVLLYSVRANNLANDSSVSWQVYIGESFTAPAVPDFGGSGAFSIASDSPADAVVNGGIAGGTFNGGPATVAINLVLVDPQHPITLHLVGARIESDLSASGCATGAKLGGAVLSTEINTALLPQLATMMNDSVQEDPTDEDSVKILDIFDTDDNGTISESEIRNSDIGGLLLDPDVDMQDAAGNLGHDGVADAVSLGVGFTCVGAVFTAANEQ